MSKTCPCMHVCFCFCICACTFMHVCMYVCMYVCIYACMHVCMYACMHVCMYACIFACRRVCMYAWMYDCGVRIRVGDFGTSSWASEQSHYKGPADLPQSPNFSTALFPLLPGCLRPLLPTASGENCYLQPRLGPTLDRPKPYRPVNCDDPRACIGAFGCSL